MSYAVCRAPCAGLSPSLGELRTANGELEVRREQI